MRRLAFLALLSMWLALPAFSQSTASQAYQLTVTAAPCTSFLAINPVTFPPAVADGKSTFTYTFTATAPAPPCVLPLKWTVTAGTLPAGLTLSSAGVLSGVLPVSDCTTGTCTFNFTVTVADSETTPATAKARVR